MSQGRRIRRGAGVLALAAALLGSASAPVHGAGEWYDWPGMSKCGTFHAEGFEFKVYASEGQGPQRKLGCRKASRLMKAWWKGPDRLVHFHENGDFYTLVRYPGWRCVSGSGGGTCRSHHRVAGYQNR